MSRALLRLTLLLIAPVLACFALLPKAHAKTGPPISCNTSEGYQALINVTTGVNDTAFGCGALFADTTGSENTATGSGALNRNTTAGANTATGYKALSQNTNGGANTANGAGALFSNIGGYNNTATGYHALANNTGTAGDDPNGFANTANGADALYSNTIGEENTAIGYQALFSNTIGIANIAVGFKALYSGTDGGNNIAIGFQALYFNTGVRNIAIGDTAGSSLTTGDLNIYIANQGVDVESRTIRIGTTAANSANYQSNTYIAGIYGVPIANSATVVVDASGHLGTAVGASSSRRFKDGIKPMDKASEAILALKPVTFRYKKELDPEGIPQFGLVAEDVAKVNPDLVVRDDKGQIYTVRYDAVNAMLLNEFLKAHRSAEEQAEKVQNLEATVASLVATVKEQATRIQKVSAQLELQKPSRETVVNNQ
jgi:hypothetical protein